MVEKIKSLISEYAIRKIFYLLPKFSKNTLIKMTYLAEKVLTKHDPLVLAAIREVRRYFKEDHPSLKLAERIHKELDKNVLNKLVQNLFINAMFKGVDKCKIFSQRYGFEPPWFMVISPTMKCNLNCKGCSTRLYSKDEDLPYELLDRILTEAKEEMGMHFIVTQGGEMFCYKDIWRLWEKHQDVYFQVYTNGTLIDKSTAKRLRELGNIAPMISIEGFEPETDSRRGKGVYKKIMQAMDNLKKEGVFFGASVTHTRENHNLVTSFEFIDMLLKKGCFVVWYFQFMPVGKDPNFELTPTPFQRLELKRFIDKVRASRPIFIGDFWNDGPYVGGCIAAGRRYLHINHKGDIEPCAFVHFATDNIKEKTLIEALQSPFFKFIRERIPYSENLFAPCMIIDNPHILRSAVKLTGAKPTHQGAEKLLEGKLREKIDEYCRIWHKISKPEWEAWKRERALCVK